MISLKMVVLQIKFFWDKLNIFIPQKVIYYLFF